LEQLAMSTSNPVHLKCGEIRIAFEDAPAGQPAKPVSLRFPGGFVEIVPGEDGSYWAHVHVSCEPPRVLSSHVYYVSDEGLDAQRDGALRHVAIHVHPSGDTP